MSRDFWCVLCSRDIVASGRSFKEATPNRAIAEIKGISVCGEHISSVVKVAKATPAPRPTR